MAFSKANRKIRVALAQQVSTAYRARFFESLSRRVVQEGFRLTVYSGKPQRGLTYSGIAPNPKQSEFELRARSRRTIFDGVKL